MTLRANERLASMPRPISNIPMICSLLNRLFFMSLLLFEQNTSYVTSTFWVQANLQAGLVEGPGDKDALHQAREPLREWAY
jgi:hypothetical protein